MASLIGINTRTGGIKQIPSRVGLYSNGVGLGAGEQHPDTITIVRDMRVFPGNGGETTPDFNTFQPSTAVTWADYGRYWWKERTEGGGNFRAAWALNPADYYQLQNERGGNDLWAIQRMVDIERAISWAAGADGVKCCILNLAGGTPGDFEVWKAICAPFIVEAWETWGHIYGRHAYSDKFVNDDGSIVPGQPQRVIAELEYLRSIGYGGGMALTECGLFGGYGVAEYSYFEQQVTRWEAALRPYADMFIGLCFWELGESEFEADYTDHLKQLLPYIQAGDLPRWTPPTEPPDNEEPPMDCNPRVPYGRKYLVAPQGATLEEWIAICESAFPGRNSVTFSYDDAGHAPGVTSNTAVLHGIPLELQQMFIEWYAVHYPGTAVEFADDTSLQIINIVDDLPLAFARYGRTLDQIDAIAIHHFASNSTIQQVHDYHRSLGWPGIGYHFVVDHGGEVYQTIPLDKLGTHVANHNTRSIGVALRGNFTDQPPTPAMLDSARQLVAHLKQLVPTIEEASGHRQFPGAQTQCPGNTWSSWLPYVTGGEIVQPEPEPPPPPPPAKTYDLLTYMRGPDKIQYDTDAKAFTQTYQYRHEANSAWKLVKGGNGQYEYLYADAKNIYRREDISQGNDRFYVHYTNGIPGAPWVKRHMAVGETAVFSKDVIHYWNDCSIRIPKTAVSDSIRLNAVYDSYTFPGTGKTLANVIELEWLDGGEKYWFAAGFGLVGFTDGPITSEFMGGPLQGRADLPVNVPGCTDLSGRYYVP